MPPKQTQQQEQKKQNSQQQVYYKPKESTQAANSAQQEVSQQPEINAPRPTTNQNQNMPFQDYSKNQKSTTQIQSQGQQRQYDQSQNQNQGYPKKQYQNYPNNRQNNQSYGGQQNYRGNQNNQRGGAGQGANQHHQQHGQGGYQQFGGQQRGGKYQNQNNQNRYQNNFGQFNLAQMANMVGQLDIIHHTENLQNIDRSELQGLFMQLMQIADTQFVQDPSSEGNNQGQLMNAINQINHMQMAGGAKRQHAGFDPNVQQMNTSQSQINKKYQPKKPDETQQQIVQDSTVQHTLDTSSKSQGQSLKNYLCLEHFPEPIIMTYDQPLCKKCIPEYIAKQQLKSTGSQTVTQQQRMNNARLLGINSLALNAYQSEKSQISRSLEKIKNFRHDFRKLDQEINKREEFSEVFLKDLPPLMNSMFDKLEELVNEAESRFENKILQIVKNQHRNIEDDIRTKLPQFYQRLEQKYQQLQMASNLAQQRSNEDLLETLKHYFTVFTELDAEYEKYFNDYEKMSKLQRLLDQDPNEILTEFKDLVEKDLRVDYNIKSSFGSQLPQRLHSFQWNQRCSQIFRIKTGIFEKKQVTMQFEVPLYSRSIATESGMIYLTGGYIKHDNMYLNTCFRYDEIFSTLVRMANMNKTHADHSICCVDGFIYVVGTFVNNVVYGHCEQYDTQKDQWKEIDTMKVPRSGVSLCSFKSNYIFAFGGRVDQKQIVDTIECYDISRNVWQEIPAPLVDKNKWVPAYMGLAYQITENEILIFGGKSALTFQIFNGCFVFDVEKMQIRERGSLVNPCSFMNTPLVFNRCLFAYGNDIFVHKYDIPEQKWSVIPKTSSVLSR